MGEVVYALCALTSVLCSALLFRAWYQHRQALLLLSAVCFFGLAGASILLFVDLVLVGDRDLSVIRAAVTALAMSSLVTGLVWTTRTS